jgi:hypothetical protein
MAITKPMFEGVMKVAKTHPGCVIDLAFSNSTNILVVDGRTNRRWLVDREGKVRRIVTKI